MVSYTSAVLDTPAQVQEKISIVLIKDRTLGERVCLVRHNVVGTPESEKYTKIVERLNNAVDEAARIAGRTQGNIMENSRGIDLRQPPDAFDAFHFTLYPPEYTGALLAVAQQMEMNIEFLHTNNDVKNDHLINSTLRKARGEVRRA